MRDTVGLSALRLGFDPATITDDQYNAALAEIKKAIDSKLVRTIKGNDYLTDLASGDVVLSMAWSGDIIQLRRTRHDGQFAVAKEGGMLWTDNMMIPKGAAEQEAGRGVHRLLLRPGDRAQVEDFVNYVCPVKGAKEALLAINPDNANNPLIFPPADVVARLHVFKGLDEDTEKKYLEPGTRSSACRFGPRPSRRRERGRMGEWAVPAPQVGALPPAGAGPPLAGRLLRLPGLPDVPRVAVGRVDRDRVHVHLPDLELHRQPARYSDQFVRSLAYGACGDDHRVPDRLPAGLRIAFRAGRYRNLLLFLVIAPFFTSFLLRTLSWKIILADNGMILGPLKELGLVPEDFRLLATPAAVVAGITYNFLPFMTLPLYVALEKIDRRLVEAAEDLYAGPWRPGGTIAGAPRRGRARGPPDLDLRVVGPGRDRRRRVVGAIIGTLFVSQSFLWVILPLSLPGVFAGSLLTFIPAVGDYVNAELLGTPTAQMIGNVIQSRFLKVNDIPTASALSFTLMAMILVAVFIYARVLGTEDLTGGAV